MSIETIERIYLAALSGLLHDIGKFAVRAAVGSTRTWDTDAEQDYKYKHALLTADFVERVVPEPWRTRVKLMAGDHHRPQNRDDWLITVADRLSAGERADARSDDNNARASHPPQQLSIFCSIEADKQRAPAHSYLPLTPLSLQRDLLFPGAALPRDQAWRQYEGLWSDFLRDAEQLGAAHGDNGDLTVFVENMLLLMQRYTWCIPSAWWKDTPDISLYDHSRMTAALAAVLAKSGLSQAELMNSPAPEKPLALLVGGDMSGIQDFIYTISSRGATSALRGRSFYLQLLTEAAARYLLRRLGLPITNLIYAGGGHFYLLAAPGDEAKLAAVQQEISRLLLRHHKGDLYLALAQQPLHSADFRRMGSARQGLMSTLLRAKQRRFAELGAEQTVLFQAHGLGSDGDLPQNCQVCGAEHNRAEVDAESRTPGNAQGVRKCPACRAYEELGRDLRNAQFLLLAEQAPVALGNDLTAEAGDWREVLAGLGMRAEVGDDANRLNWRGPHAVLLALTDQALAEVRPSPTCAVGRRLLVNVSPILRETDVEELEQGGFTDLADLEIEKRRVAIRRGEIIKPYDVMEWQSQGVKRLGVLRMDVDHLGAMFASGLGDNASLSRWAALSFAVSLYFEGWVGELARQQNEEDGADRLYAIYSGGDDLFFVGSWDATLKLAQRIRDDLSEYAARHPGVHASAGVALVSGKYPLYLAASDAGAAEDAAKDSGRNAITFLDQPVKWSDAGNAPDFAQVQRRVEQIGGWLAGKKINRSFLMNLRAIDAEWRAGRKQERGEKRREGLAPRYAHRDKQMALGPWLWHLVYNLARAMDRRVGKDMQVETKEMVTALVAGEISVLGLTARWVELQARGRNQDSIASAEMETK